MEKKGNKRKNKLFKNKKSLILFSVAILLLLAGTVMTLAQNPSSSGEKYKLYRVSKAESLIFDGKVQPEETQDIFQNPSYGKVDAILVKDGSHVTKGQGLVQYRNKEVENQVKEARRNLDKAKDSAKYAKEDYDKAYSKYLDADKKYRNAPDYATKQELKAIRDQAEEGKDTLSRAKREADTAVKDAEQSIWDMEANIIHIENAYVDGIAHVNERAMNNPNAQEAVLNITSKNLIVIGSLTEFDYSEIKDRDKVVLAPVNGDPEVNGTVVEKASSPAQSLQMNTSSPGEAPSAGGGESSSFQFKIQPDKPIQNGFSVSIKKEKEGLILPWNVVEEGEEGKHFIYLYKDGVVSKREIDVTKGKDGFTVNGGVSEGMELFELNEGLEDGMEVRVDEIETDSTEKTE